MQNYAPFHLAYGDLSEKLGRSSDATSAFETALECDTNQPLKQLIEGRINAVIDT